MFRGKLLLLHHPVRLHVLIGANAADVAGRHSVSDPLPAAVGCKVVEMLTRDNLAARAAQLGDILISGLRELQQKYESIGDVRGRGLLVGLEVVEDRTTRAPADKLGDALADRMMELGLSANIARIPGKGACMRIAPPLTVSEEELREGLRIIEEAFETTEGTKHIK